MSHRRPSRSGGERGTAGRAALSGALLGLAFLPLPLGFLAWFAFIPLIDALHLRVQAGSRARGLFALGYVFGLVFFLISTHWIAALAPVAITIPWLRYPAWLAAAAYLALFPAFATLLAGSISRQSGWSVAVTFPAAYLAIEVLRGAGELGFPWFQPGYSQHGFAPLIQLASLGSVTLVTLWLLVLNALLWRSLTARARLRTALGALLCFVLPWAWGLRALDAAPRDRGAVVALVQPNIPGEVKWAGTHEAEIMATLMRLSEQAAADTLRPSLIVWPETATGSYMRKRVDQVIPIAQFAARTGIPVFAGYADWEIAPDGRPRSYNAAGVISPGNMSEARYAKRHLVPFGERMPFQRLFPQLGKLELGQAEWASGDRTVLFDHAAGVFSCLICFESIFPALARTDVQHGARWLVNVTNDEWFGNSAAIPQHAAMAQFRAVENHVPLARCANTGLTALIDANGRVRSRLPILREGVLVGALGVAGPPTLYGRVGDWPAWLAFASLLVCMVLPSRAGRERWR